MIPASGCRSDGKRIMPTRVWKAVLKEVFSFPLESDLPDVDDAREEELGKRVARDCRHLGNHQLLGLIWAEMNTIRRILHLQMERDLAADALYAEDMKSLRRSPSEVRSQGPAASEGPLPSPSCTAPGPGPSEE